MEANNRFETHLVVCQPWREHEKGWGNRPAGFTLRRTVADRDRFVAKYAAKHHTSSAPPTEYETPLGDPYPLDVATETYETVLQVDGLWCHGDTSDPKWG